MNSYKSDILKILCERGYIYQCSDIDALDNLASKKKLTAYIGFDCTAPSLHVGSLLGIMMLRKLQQNGHKPIILLGGGTTKVGDPSGKDKSRKILNEKDISFNMKEIKKIFNQFLTIGNNKTDALILDNDEWLKELNYINLLRDYGKHFTINKMLSFESVKQRLEREQPLTFLEFNYMVLQAFDFVELSQRYGCQLQMGGSDQWGNIINGIELARKMNGTNLFGLTCPLLTTSSGVKMGKTVDGAIWLNANKTSAYDYWQYWRNTEDNDVIKFLKLFTEIENKEITEFKKLKGSDINKAKIILADAATKLAHGERLSKEVSKASKKLFVDNNISQKLPSINISNESLSKGIGLLTLIVQGGLAKSNGEARRLIIGNGVKLNDIIMNDIKRSVDLKDLTDSNNIKLSVGKKKHIIIKSI